MGRNENDENPIINNRPRIITGSNGVISSNGTNTVTISNVAPAGVTTATIAQWLVINSGGVDYFIPMWT